MTPNDDEALARLRVALHAIADRTPISGGRLDAVSAAATERRTHPTVTIVSAAAAVAAIAAVSAVVVGAHSGGSRAISPGAGGSKAPTVAPTLTPTLTPTRVASPEVTKADQASRGVPTPSSWP